jgi:hypothetical protein
VKKKEIEECWGEQEEILEHMMVCATLELVWQTADFLHLANNYSHLFLHV